MTGVIIAILPEPVKGIGICSRVFRQDRVYLDRKAPTHFLKVLYDSKGKTKKKVDNNIKRDYQVLRNLPYVIDASQVFFAFNARKSTYDRETRGFVNVGFVDRIEGSQIILTSGETISTLNREDSLISNRILAKALMYEQIVKLRRDEFHSIKFLTAMLREDRETPIEPKVEEPIDDFSIEDNMGW